jgi:hypothetical protein
VRLEVKNGAFASGHLDPGRWFLRVMPASPAGKVSAYDTAELELKGPGDHPVSLIERAAGLDVEVVVADRDGAPTPSDLLLVPRKENTPADDQHFAKLLGRPGLVGDETSPSRYRFLRVPPGAYTLLACARGRVWTVALPLLVQQGQLPIRLTWPQLPYSP